MREETAVVRICRGLHILPILPQARVPLAVLGVALGPDAEFHVLRLAVALRLRLAENPCPKKVEPLRHRDLHHNRRGGPLAPPLPADVAVGHKEAPTPGP